MKMMSNKLAGFVPTLSKKTIFFKNIAYEQVSLERGARKQFLEVPYLLGVVKYFETEGSILNKRIILAGENVRLAMKAALCMMSYWEMQEEKNASNKIKKMRVLNLAQEVKNDTNFVNPFVDLLSINDNSEAVFYYGVTDGTLLEHKLNLIKASENEIEFLFIHSEDLGKPWLNELRKVK